MKRTIKFRGKRLDNGEWVYGSLLQEKINGVITESIIVDRGFGREYVQIASDTTGQYFATLPDGTELYEGDVVLVKDSVKATVVWSGHGFHIYGSEDVNGRCNDYTLSNPMRKIGTIYDHLLNEK